MIRYFKNMLKIVLKAINSCLVVVIVLFLRAISPLIIIRLGAIDSWRIGNNLSLDFYLTLKKQKRLPAKTLDLFFDIAYSERTTNIFFLKILKQNLTVIPASYLIKKVYQFLLAHTDYHQHLVAVLGDVSCKQVRAENISAIINSTLPVWQVSWKDRQHEIALFLKHFNLNKNTQFVCVHARDSAFMAQEKSQVDWSVHDYRDANIDNYVSAMSYLTSLGVKVIRVGKVAKKSLSPTSSDFIDYAFSNWRSDVLDIFLAHACRFFIGSDSGISAIPQIFRKPIVFVNLTFLKLPKLEDMSSVIRNRTDMSFVNNALIIFKKYYSKETNRLLTFKEKVAFDMAMPVSGQSFINANIELIENSEEEILAVIQEMELRLQGKWVENEEDQKLQAQFWSLFDEDMMHYTNMRVGTVFLRKYSYLL